MLFVLYGVNCEMKMWWWWWFLTFEKYKNKILKKNHRQGWWYKLRFFSDSAEGMTSVALSKISGEERKSKGWR